MPNWITRHWLWFDPASAWCEMGRAYEQHCQCWEKAMAALDAMGDMAGVVAMSLVDLIRAQEAMRRSFGDLAGGGEGEA